MTFIKANLDVLICGLVAFLALGFCFWPVGSWDKQTVDEMQARYAQVQSANRLILPNVEIIPGGPKLPNATPEENVIDAKKEALAQVNSYAKRVEDMAAEQNWARRIEKKGSGNAPQEVPLFSGNPLPNFLPKITGGAFAFAFKHPYSEQFAQWTAKLSGGSESPVPPSAQELEAKVAQANQERQNAAQATNTMIPGSGGSAQLSPRETNDLKKRAIYERASKIRCYVDDHALQMRDWGAEGAPTEGQIFDAIVDSWLQQDVVKAISDVNDAQLKLPKYQGEQDVAHSPVKRLEHIVIGNNAMDNSGTGLFFGVSAAGAPGGAAAANTDASRTVTGHVSNEAYDVVLMRITLDIDPAFQNEFIDALYRQNNGYTVLNISTRAVDPLETAGNGFLFGSTQVVRLDILVEELMFRSWTVPLMPDETKKSLSIASAGGFLGAEVASPGPMALSR